MLLDATYGDAEGFAQITVGHFEDDKLKIDRQRWFSVPAELGKLKDFVQRNADSDVYFTTSVFSEKTRTNDNAVRAHIIWIDADTCAPENFRVPPTFSVETSPGKWQCYWLLDAPVPSTQASTLVHKISQAHKDQGADVSSWTANKIMRVPGTSHTKTGQRHEVSLTENTGEVFAIKDLEKAYKDIKVADSVTVNPEDMGELPDKTEVASKIPGHLLDTFTGGNYVEHKRSEARYQFELELLRHGFTKEEVFVATQNAAGGRLDKFSQEGRPDYLWREICKAEQAIFVDVAGETAPSFTTEDVVEFLDAEEREFVENNPTFIDEYTGWAKTRSPQSAETYHRTLSLVVLSCIYGSWAYVKTPYGEEKLNLWALIVGDSTSTKKSTSKNLALSVIRGWERRANKSIIIGSDATSEGLVKTLAERDGLVSLLHRDEFHGWIKEMYTKNYLSGLQEVLTDLYDGLVPKSIRATKDSGNDKDATTIFNMMMMGTPKEVSSALNTSNFSSGFLPRYVWAVAETPEWKPEDEHVDLTMDDEDEEQPIDEQAMKFRNDFELARRAWNSTKPKRMRISPEANERWNQWKVDSKRHIMGMHNEDILNPGRDRMSWSVIKSAALLAIHDRSDTVQMKHLLPVLAQSELWMFDLIKMANSIASSDFEDRSNKIEMMVAQAGGEIELKKVYQAFKTLPTGNVDENIRSLEFQGKVKTIPRSGKRFLTNGTET